MQKEAAAAANARNVNAKAGKKKGNKKPKKSKSKHKRTGRKCPTDIDEEVIADANVCDACGGDCLSEVLDEYERVVTDIQQVKAKITKIFIKRRRCTDCKKLVSGKDCPGTSTFQIWNKLHDDGNGAKAARNVESENTRNRCNDLCHIRNRICDKPYGTQNGTQAWTAVRADQKRGTPVSNMQRG